MSTDMINLFSPDDDIISSCDATAPYRSTPERRLWISVLQLAIDDLAKNEILEWIETDDFKFICKAVGCRPVEAAKHLKVIHSV